MPATTDIASARARARARAKSERASASALGARLLELGAALILSPAGYLREAERRGKSLLAAELAARAAFANVTVERTLPRTMRPAHFSPRKYTNSYQVLTDEGGESIEVIDPHGRRLPGLNLDTGEGVWIVDAVDGVVLLGYEARRWWLRRTAESALTRAGWHGKPDFDEWTTLGAQPSNDLRELDKRLRDSWQRVREGSRVLFACGDEHQLWLERRARKLLFDDEPADDFVPLDHNFAEVPITAPKWRAPGGGWLCIAPRAVLAQMARWPGDAPTRCDCEPCCDDWLSFPFPTTSGCEEAGDAR